MAYSPEEIKQNYPLPVYNYRVVIDTDSVSFSQVSGLNLSFEAHTYKESPTAPDKRGPVVMRAPAQQADVKITLKKGLVKGKSMPVLFKWINSIQANQIQKKDIQIHLLSPDGKPVISWTVQNAFPTKLEAPGFDANSNDVAIETMELTADTILISEA